MDLLLVSISDYLKPFALTSHVMSFVHLFYKKKNIVGVFTTVMKILLNMPIR